MPSFWEVKDSNRMFYTTCVTALFSGIGSFSTNHVGRRSPLTSWELKSDPKNKSPAIALFLFVGYILSFVIRFIVNAPDSLLIKHELDLEGFEHQDSLDRTSKYGSYRYDSYRMVRLRPCINSWQKNLSISKRNAYESNPPCSDQIRYLGMRKWGHFRAPIGQ